MIAKHRRNIDLDQSQIGTTAGELICEKQGISWLLSHEQICEMHAAMINLQIWRIGWSKRKLFYEMGQRRVIAFEEHILHGYVQIAQQNGVVVAATKHIQIHIHGRWVNFELT